MAADDMYGMVFAQVYVHHVGDMRFKGVRGLQRVVAISTTATSCRKFPTYPPTAKGKVVRPSSGLQLVVERRIPRSG